MPWRGVTRAWQGRGSRESCERGETNAVRNSGRVLACVTGCCVDCAARVAAMRPGDSGRSQLADDAPSRSRNCGPSARHAETCFRGTRRFDRAILFSALSVRLCFLRAALALSTALRSGSCSSTPMASSGVPPAETVTDRASFGSSACWDVALASPASERSTELPQRSHCFLSQPHRQGRAPFYRS